ncbi:rhodanese-like domain-containing protein [Demequina lignilytica]|uniref:Rhodanese-like domain-containing protein n=1 Tax=Demequina lignilytica TaxID=3051663 RepID=A0AB35MH51_9MICO|nr:rhodanese-like domain-containing protein [Demequina sp. SYSU T0a273]MDN4483040.1 rhodanese-like domain-containing protein [Demequina sp. SYSU T0a273]
MIRIKTRAAMLGAAMLAAVTLSACSGGEDAPLAFDGGHVSAERFAEAVATDGVVVIDVRTPAEYAEGHLPEAVNIDVQGADFDAQVAALDPEGEYAVYCRSGNRSRAAIEEMAADGVEGTVGLEGGIGAWTGDIVAG